MDHFIASLNKTHGKSVRGINKEVLGILMAHEYPGNIRELKNNYDRNATAKDLGIDKSILFRKIDKLKIELPKIDGRFKKAIFFLKCCNFESLYRRISAIF